jgi:hypothetical protein
MGFEVEWHLIKKSLTVFLMIVAITGLSIFTANYYLEQKWLQLQHKDTDLERIKTRYRNTVNDQAVYGEYVERYKKMEKLGVVEGENRLSWIESLQKVNSKLKLPLLRYELFPQKTLVVESEFNEQERLKVLTVKKTNMTITSGLFHELDLIDIFDGLSKSKGLYSIRWCQLKNNATQGILSVKNHNIFAQCLLEWYSINVVENNEQNNF